MDGLPVITLLFWEKLSIRKISENVKAVVYSVVTCKLGTVHDCDTTFDHDSKGTTVFMHKHFFFEEYKNY